jgi:hypothetical protein
MWRHRTLAERYQNTLDATASKAPNQASAWVHSRLVNKCITTRALIDRIVPASVTSTHTADRRGADPRRWIPLLPWWASLSMRQGRCSIKGGRTSRRHNHDQDHDTVHA